MPGDSGQPSATASPKKASAPFAGRPSRVVDCIQMMTELAAKGGNRPSLECVCIPFLDGLPTVKHPVRCHQDCILR